MTYAVFCNTLVNLSHARLNDNAGKAMPQRMQHIDIQQVYQSIYQIANR
jgi:hypothetical protein